jgi:hypothetical protein
MQVIVRARDEVKVESPMTRDISLTKTVLTLILALPGIGVAVRVVDAVVP